MRINHGDRLRQSVRRKMMIRDDKLHFKLVDIFRLVDCAYSVIDGDYQLNAHQAELVDSLIAQTVTLGVAVRNIIDNVRALHFKVRIQQRSRGHSVCIIIAVDGNSFKSVKSLLYPLNRRVHIGKVHRINAFAFVKSEKFPRLLNRIYSSRRCDQSGIRTDSELFGNKRCVLFITAFDYPLFPAHIASPFFLFIVYFFKLANCM